MAITDSWKVPLGFLLCYALVTCAWIAAVPATQVPDEPSHYIKALGVSEGQLRGAKPNPPLDPRNFQTGTSGLGTFTVPGRLVSASSSTLCLTRRPSSSCLSQPSFGSGTVTVLSTAANYPPLPYVLPGLFAHLGHSETSGILLGRVGEALVFLALLGVALRLLWDPDRPQTSLLGLVVAVTPMVIFFNAAINPDGTEIAASLCYIAAWLRVSRPIRPNERWPWVALAVSGLVVANSHPEGALWAVGLALVIVVIRWRSLWESLHRAPRTALPATAGILIGLVLAGAWNLYAKAGSPAEAWLPAIGTVIANTPTHFGRYVSQQIGVFGWLDVPLPGLLPWLWLATFFVVVAMAIVVGRRRDRLIVIGLLVGDVVVTVGMTLLIRIESGATGKSGMQGRYVLPFLILIALVSAFVIGEQRDKLRAIIPQRLFLYVMIAVGVIQTAAWAVVARRYSLDTNGGWGFFFGHAQWNPPLGWLPWLALVLAGWGGMVVLAARMCRPPVELGVGSDIVPLSR